MEEISWLPYTKRYKYPGMSERDAAIWERFIEKNPEAFDVVAYNVAVGAGASFDTVVNPTTGGDANRLYQRKMDVLARGSGQEWIIEIGPRASTAKIGQVEGYKALYLRDRGPGMPVNIMVLTDELLPDMEFLAKEKGVNVLLA